MSKYIDAEKLLAEIQRRKEQDITFRERNILVDIEMFIASLRAEMIITSLQQEQSELQGYNKALLEVKSKVDELYEEAGIGLCEYDSGLYNGIAETCMKLRGFIKARLDSDEQPESELEKAARYVYESWNGGTMDDVRRDMVELGKVLKKKGIEYE